VKAELAADGTIVLRAPANAATIVRRIPGARHDAKRNVWTLPLSWAACQTARGVIGDSLEVGPKLAEWARMEHAGRIAPALELRDSRELPTTSIWSAVFEEVEVAEGLQEGR
jgi:hypothetical protein